MQKDGRFGLNPAVRLLQNTVWTQLPVLHKQRHYLAASLTAYFAICEVESQLSQPTCLHEGSLFWLPQKREEINSHEQ